MSFSFFFFFTRCLFLVGLGLRSGVLLYLSDPPNFHMLCTGESYLTILVQVSHFQNHSVESFLSHNFQMS